MIILLEKTIGIIPVQVIVILNTNSSDSISSAYNSNNCNDSSKINKHQGLLVVVA